MDRTASAERPGLEKRFGELILASFAFAPLALLLAFASLVFMVTVLYRLPLPEGLVSTVVLLWLSASHGLFVTFLCAFTALPGVRAGRRFAVAFKAGARGAPAMTLVFAFAFCAPFVTPFLSVAIWAAACFMALPARFVDRGMLGLETLARPLPVPAAHRIALMTPSMLFLSFMAWLLPQGSWGLMDGGMIMLPMLGFTLFWGSYSAALFSAHFAWEGRA